MRNYQLAARVSLGVFLLVGCARLAGAQTYIWTDDRGVVHAASDPAEVPAKHRAKAIRDAASPRSPVTVLPDGENGPPARPAHAERNAPPAAAARSYEGDSPAETTGGGVGLDAKPEVTPPPAAAKDTAKPKKFTGKGMPPPDPGFEWSCIPDPDGGPPKCEQFEKKTNKRERRADARRKAREALGVDAPEDEFDPDLAKKVDRRAEEEYKKTTPVPKTKVRGPSGDDEDSGEDESDSSDDEPEN